MGSHMVRAAEELLSAVAGLKSARVEVDPNVFWTSADMTEAGRIMLDLRRQNSLSAAVARPQRWRERVQHQRGRGSGSWSGSEACGADACGG